MIIQVECLTGLDANTKRSLSLWSSSSLVAFILHGCWSSKRCSGCDLLLALQFCFQHLHVLFQRALHVLLAARTRRMPGLCQLEPAGRGGRRWRRRRSDGGRVRCGPAGGDRRHTAGSATITSCVQSVKVLRHSRRQQWTHSLNTSYSSRQMHSSREARLNCVATSPLKNHNVKWPWRHLFLFCACLYCYLGQLSPLFSAVSNFVLEMQRHEAWK